MSGHKIMREAMAHQDFKFSLKIANKKITWIINRKMMKAFLTFLFQFMM